MQVVHLSGLIGALSPETGAFCLDIARAAFTGGASPYRYVTAFGADEVKASTNSGAAYAGLLGDVVEFFFSG